MFFFIVLINIEDRASIFEHLMFPFLNKQLKTGLISLSNELLYPFSSIASEWHRIMWLQKKQMCTKNGFIYLSQVMRVYVYNICCVQQLAMCTKRIDYYLSFHTCLGLRL